MMTRKYYWSPDNQASVTYSDGTVITYAFEYEPLGNSRARWTVTEGTVLTKGPQFSTLDLEVESIALKRNLLTRKGQGR